MRPPAAAGDMVIDTVVIGVGNPYRCDDGAGKEVVERLRAALQGRDDVRLLDLDGEPVRLMQAWGDATTVILVDAVRSGASAGTVHEADARSVGERPSPGVDLGGGHLLGISEAISLARALDRLPAGLRVLGIEGASFEHGVGLSPEVDAACDEVVERVLAAVAPAGAG